MLHLSKILKIFSKKLKARLNHSLKGGDLGEPVFVKDGIVVANCYGQVFPGNGCMTDYKAWNSILDKLKDLSNYFNLDLHFPWMVGCGLAGGDWNVMRKKIENAFSGPNAKVFIHRLAQS